MDDRRALVWLDGLDRYAEALDAECLSSLRSLGNRVTLVATIRTKDWDEWLGSSGAAGEAARAVVAQARVFPVPALLTNSELDAARALYPDADFSAGVGMALGSGGRDSGAPPEQQAESGEYAESPPLWRRDAQVIAPAALTCASLIVLGLLIGLSGFRTPSINDQIAADEREGSHEGRHAALVTKVDLHGSGVNSWLVLFTDNVDARKAHSDELRIYDERGESLVRAFRFEPTGPRAVFKKRAIADIDFDGANEIVGGYAYANESEGAGAMVPFAIDWDRARERYVMVSLDQGRPRLSRRAIKIPEQQYRRVYAETTTFSDPADHHQIKGHRVQDFAISASPHRLIAGWVLRPSLEGHNATFELHTAILDSHTGAPHLTPCTLTSLRAPLVVAVGKDRELSKVFEERYERVPNNRACLPRYG